METFGETLADLRRRAQVSQKRLAPQLGVTYPYLSKLESDQARPSRELVTRVATYFDYSEDRLLLAADRVPDDVLQILKDRPDDAVALLRQWVADDRSTGASSTSGRTTD
jgi:transcriptional regulator with XRE-family HTH domain